MADYVEYDLILGSFEGEDYIWKTLKHFTEWEKAYKAYKDFVNEQIQLDDEELLKIWSSPRLDVELKQGPKLINWVGIYSRRVDKTINEEDEEEDDDKKDDKEEK